MELIERIKEYQKKGLLPDKTAQVLINFIPEYFNAVEDVSVKSIDYKQRLNDFIEMAVHEIASPYHFPLYHTAQRSPFDYIQFGKDFFRPLINLHDSKALGLNYVDEIEEFLSSGGNVILFANHQIEPDPIVISTLLEKTHKKFSEELVFVAGDRVTTDPLAAQFSKGMNLLCVYSKRHVESPPEKKEEKLAHNKSVMATMKNLLDEGGKCIYVAPSGGRDRPNANGKYEVAPFHQQSLAMFRLMAKKAQRQTLFYPLALWSHPLMPPPRIVEEELQEKREAKRTPVHLTFGEKIDIEHYPGCNFSDKEKRREAFAKYAWNRVNELYKQLDTGE